MDFPYQALTFDCFGTLMDWRRGQREALEALPESAPLLAGGAEAFHLLDARRMEAEQELQAGEYRSYAEVLGESLSRAGEACGIHYGAASLHRFADAMGTWPAFPDSAEALGRLAGRVQVGLLSNCDDAVLRRVAEDQLACPEAVRISAEAVRSYKPQAPHWEAFLRRSGLRPEQVLHVSAYAFYDLAPAARLGFATAFIRRDDETLPAGMKVTHQAEDVLDLVRQLGLAEPRGAEA
ncbi:MAG: HAD-IA family hydrolase [Planctomycetota bacterium]|jgi:2-haloalkanoic acid dehalogenase type II